VIAAFLGAQAASLFILAACRDAPCKLRLTVECMCPPGYRKLQASSLYSPGRVNFAFPNSLQSA